MLSGTSREAAAEFLGTFVLIVFGTAVVRQVAGPRATAGIFATYPQEFLSNVPGGLVDQVVGTALLLLLIFALVDRRNSAPEAALAPVLIGLAVVLIGMTFGYNAGYAINPARDLGPRLF